MAVITFSSWAYILYSDKLERATESTKSGLINAVWNLGTGGYTNY